MKMIVAVDNKWGIGKNGDLLANLPMDKKYFKEKTLNSIVIMGRKTLESLPGGKPLKNRLNIVITRNPSYRQAGCFIYSSIASLIQYLETCTDTDNVWVIGGAEIYNQLYKQCDEIYVTKMDTDLGADVFIKNFDEDPNYVLKYESEEHEQNGISFRFCQYEKR